MSNSALLSKIMNRLSAGDRFPRILMKDTEDKTVCIPEEVNTKYCILLFFRGAWWPKCTLQLEGYRKHSLLFGKLDATIVAGSVDNQADTKQLAAGKRFPKREKEMGFTLCYGVDKKTSDMLGAYWNHNDNFMQPAEFVIDCYSGKIVICAYSDGGLGRMDAGDVIGVLSGIEKRREEFPHVWSWWSTFTYLGPEAKLTSTNSFDGLQK